MAKSKRCSLCQLPVRVHVLPTAGNPLGCPGKVLDDPLPLPRRYVYEGLDVPDYGGAFDGIGTVYSDADPGL